MCERPFAHTDITSREAAAQEFHFSKMNNIFQCLRGLNFWAHITLPTQPRNSVPVGRVLGFFIWSSSLSFCIYLFGLKSHRSAGDAGLDDLWCPHEQEPKIAAALFLSSIHSSTLLQLRLFLSCFSFSWYFPNEEEEEGIDLLPGTQ